MVNEKVEAIERLPIVEARTGLKKSALYGLVREHKFPAPVPITGKAKGWLRSEVSAWIQERVAARDTGGAA